MSEETIALNNNKPIMLTTGVYDLIKEHVRKKKVTPAEEETLRLQLKGAMQVSRRHLPANVVDINTRVTVKDHATNEVRTHVFVAPDRAKKRNNTDSILTTTGLALVGCQEGDVITWHFEDGVRQIEILGVERLS